MRFVRYKCKTLFVGVTVVCVLLGTSTEGLRREMDIQRQLTARGATVSVCSRWPWLSEWCDIALFRCAERVVMNKGSDVDVDLLAQLPAVSEVRLSDSVVSSRALAALAHLSSLELLTLKGVRCDDAPGFSVLSGLPALKHVMLCGLEISDDELWCLVQEWSSLETLYVGDLVPDEHFHDLLGVDECAGGEPRYTTITAQGLARIQASRPGLQIVDGRQLCNVLTLR
jgi:hypothetical protein